MSDLTIIGVAALSLLAGCAPSTPAQEATDGMIRGTVQSVDMTPTYSDGNGLVTVNTGEGRLLTLQIPARVSRPEEGARRCGSDALQLASELQPGDPVEIGGEIEGSDIYLCKREDDFVRRAR